MRWVRGDSRQLMQACLLVDRVQGDLDHRSRYAQLCVVHPLQTRQQAEHVFALLKRHPYDRKLHLGRLPSKSLVLLHMRDVEKSCREAQLPLLDLDRDFPVARDLAMRDTNSMTPSSSIVRPQTSRFDQTGDSLFETGQRPSARRRIDLDRDFPAARDVAMRDANPMTPSSFIVRPQTSRFDPVEDALFETGQRPSARRRSDLDRDFPAARDVAMRDTNPMTLSSSIVRPQTSSFDPAEDALFETPQRPSSRRRTSSTVSPTETSFPRTDSTRASTPNFNCF